MTDLNSTKRHAEKILSSLNGVERDLKSAKNWGIIDIFGGEGFTSFVKHRKISAAERRLEEVIYELSLLQRELRDLEVPGSSQINAGSFNKFMDIFMDNTFSDIYTQSKINQGLRDIQEMKAMVEKVYRDLDRI